MHVDRSRQPDHAVDDRATEQFPPARTGSRAEDDLGGVLGSREVDQRPRDVVAVDAPVFAPELLDEPALGGHPRHRRLVAGRQAGVRDHVHADQLALGPLGDAGCPAHEVIRVGRTGQGDDDPLAGLPRPGDAMTVAVLVQGVVDPVGDPQQRQFTQRRQVARPEVVAESRVDLVGAIDVAVGQPPPQRFGRHVDELDLIGCPYGVVRHGLPLADPGDPFDDVVERLEVLDVDGRDDVDAGGEDLLDVLPPLVVARARDVGVSELVDQHEIGPAAQDGVDIHLGDRRAAMLHGATGHDLEIADLLGRTSPSVRLDEADDDVGPALSAPMRFVEHGERLADARRGAEVDAQGARSGPGRTVDAAVTEVAERTVVYHPQEYRAHDHPRHPGQGERLTSSRCGLRLVGRDGPRGADLIGDGHGHEALVDGGGGMGVGDEDEATDVMAAGEDWQLDTLRRAVRTRHGRRGRAGSERTIVLGSHRCGRGVAATHRRRTAAARTSRRQGRGAP